MYCKINKPRDTKYKRVFPNPEKVKVLAIVNLSSGPYRVVVEANWDGCMNPLRAYGKRRLDYVDPSLDATLETISGAYWVDYEEVKIIETYESNRKAVKLLEEEY